MSTIFGEVFWSHARSGCSGEGKLKPRVELGVPVYQSPTLPLHPDQDDLSG